MENEIYELIEKWKNDSKTISKSAETELINKIVIAVKIIDDIKNMFGRSYDPNYPKMTEKHVDDNLGFLLFSTNIEIVDIDNDYIYLYYIFSRKMEKTPVKIPIDILLFCSNPINIKMYKNKVIEAEKIHLINDVEYKKNLLKEAELKLNNFCKKYQLN